MNCKQARAKVALMIGNDLDASAVGDVQKHLAQCAGCREHLQRLSSCLEVLQVPAAGAFQADGESLWPRISVRLASQTAGQKPHRLSGWAPTLAVAAACTAMFWVASYQFAGNPSVPTFAPTGQRIELQPVDFPSRFERQLPGPLEQDLSRIRDRESGRLQMQNGESPAIRLTPINERP
jgi:hypothetical protein